MPYPVPLKNTSYLQTNLLLCYFVLLEKGLACTIGRFVLWIIQLHEERFMVNGPVQGHKILVAKILQIAVPASSCFLDTHVRGHILSKCILIFIIH